MAASASNIIAGAATLWRGDLGAPEPLDTAVTALPASPDWRDLGGTDDGVTCTVAHEWFEARMDQTIDVTERRKTSRTITVATNLVEGTLENLLLAIAQSADTIVSAGTGATATRSFEAEGDDSGVPPDYSAIILRGRAPAGKVRLFVVRKVLQTEDVESAYKKDDQWLIPVTFSAHWVSPSVRPFRIIEDASV
jgi:hypothetical protein